MKERNMYKISSIAWRRDDVKKLISQLDQYEIRLYGKENYSLQSVENLAESGAYLIGAFDGNELIGIGSVKIFADYAEIKRMFIAEEYRSQGIGKTILTALEAYAKAKYIDTICLETGRLHGEALLLYIEMGYSEIERFGEYEPNRLRIYFSRSV